MILVADCSALIALASCDGLRLLDALFGTVIAPEAVYREAVVGDKPEYQAKLTLARSLYRRGYQRSDILELFRFIDWVLALPEELETQLWADVQQFEEENDYGINFRPAFG